jgi:hypothetical protein
MKQLKEKPMGDERIFFRLPSAMLDLIKKASAAEAVTISTYVRLAVLRQLEQHGLKFIPSE